MLFLLLAVQTLVHLFATSAVTAAAYDAALAVATDPENEVQEIPVAEALKPAAKEAPTAEIVTNEDLLVLLQSLEIRAKAGIPEAKKLLGQIKLLLLGGM